MIDTSSVLTGVAVVRPGGDVAAETVQPSGRDRDLSALVRSLVDPRALERVAVATGPGSFTGLRVGASYAVGLALGRRLPLLELDSLAVQQARARVPATAVVEAGRGRVFYREPGGQEGCVDAPDLPSLHPLVGWLRPATEGALRARLLEPPELRTFGEAVARRLDAAAELDHRAVRLHYMQSFELRR